MEAKSQVFNMDCLEFLREQPDKSFDLAVVDPPYGGANDLCINGGGVSVEGSTATRTGGTWATKYGKKIIGWDVAPGEEYFKELFRVSKNQIIWGGNYFSLPPTRCFLVWRKLTISESFTMAMAEYAWTSFNGNAKVFECAPQGASKDPRFHPTQKPVALYTWVFKQFAKPGDRVLDTHLGSGSSRIAAYGLDLDFTGIEIDKDYFEKSVERFELVCHGVQDIGGHKVEQGSLF